MRPHLVVFPTPSLDQNLRLLEGVEDLLLHLRSGISTNKLEGVLRQEWRPQEVLGESQV